jgi:DNA-binding transcriptional MerR regulator
MYQTKEVARMLGVTGTTVRRYAKDFREHLSDFTKRKRRQFTDTDVAILKRAQQLMGEGYTKQEINRLLYTEQIAPGGAPEAALTLFPELAQAVEQARQEVVRIHNRLDEIDARQQEQQEAWSEFREEQARQRRRERMQFWLLAGLVVVMLVLLVVMLVNGGVGG